MTMRVRYIHPQPGFNGNILWEGAWPMKHGIFPAGHPCAAGTGTSEHPWGNGHGPQFGSGDDLEAFRSRGYWASCFPEGDGICFQFSAGQTPEQVKYDIKACFGWQVAK